MAERRTRHDCRKYRSHVVPKTIVVTGCSSGIGAHCAKRLAEEGWQVFATARKPEDLARLADAGLNAHYLDYCEQDSIDALALAVLAKTGGTLDALFNNGAYSQAGAVEDLPTDALRAQFEANFFGWHSLTRAFIPVMRAQGHGRIVHNSSVFGFVPMGLRGAYVASKYALEGLMMAQRMELEGTGIFVSMIEPGPIPSKIAINALSYVEKYIDVENSVYRDLYAMRIAQLRDGGTPEDGDKGVEACYQALIRALTARRPAPHYHITNLTRGSAAARRLLPMDLLYRALSRAI